MTKLAKRNDKYIGLRLVILAFVINIVLTLVPHQVMFNRGQYQESVRLLESYTKEVIIDMEKKGYLSDDMASEIERYGKELKFDEIKVSGTKNRVNKGGKVFLVVEIKSVNLKGGKFTTSQLSQKGTVK